MAVCECGVVGESMRTHVVHGVGVPKGNGGRVCVSHDDVGADYPRAVMSSKNGFFIDGFMGIEYQSKCATQIACE